jgi:hypothetical protein
MEEFFTRSFLHQSHICSWSGCYGSLVPGLFAWVVLLVAGHLSWWYIRLPLSTTRKPKKSNTSVAGPSWIAATLNKNTEQVAAGGHVQGLEANDARSWKSRMKTAAAAKGGNGKKVSKLAYRTA